VCHFWATLYGETVTNSVDLMDYIAYRHVILFMSYTEKDNSFLDDVAVIWLFSSVQSLSTSPA